MKVCLFIVYIAIKILTRNTAYDLSLASDHTVGDFACLSLFMSFRSWNLSLYPCTLSLSKHIFELLSNNILAR